MAETKNRKGPNIQPSLRVQSPCNNTPSPEQNIFLPIVDLISCCDSLSTMAGTFSMSFVTVTITTTDASRLCK